MRYIVYELDMTLNETINWWSGDDKEYALKIYNKFKNDAIINTTVFFFDNENWEFISEEF